MAADFLLGVHRPVAGTTAAALIQASQPVFYPTMQSMTVNSPEAKTASGNAVGGSVLEFEPSVYLADGFTGNKGGVFLSRVAVGHPTCDHLQR